MFDVVLPVGNEKEFVHTAHRLGYSELVFLYSPEQYNTIQLPQSKIKISKAILLDAYSLLRNHQKYKKHFIAIKSSDKDREVLETGSCSLLFDLEVQPRRDFMHQRASGFNHILAQLAHDAKVTIGFNASLILTSAQKEVALGRIAQNLRLCKKYKIRHLFGSFADDPFKMRSSHDLRALENVLQTL